MMRRFNKQPIVVQLVIVVAVAYALRWCLRNCLEGFTGGKEFVLYHMNGCGHCKKMMPEWDKFSSSYKGGLKVRKVERGEAPDDIKKYGIQGFPTLVLVDGGEKVKAYQGARTADAFAKFCKDNE